MIRASPTFMTRTAYSECHPRSDVFGKIFCFSLSCLAVPVMGEATHIAGSRNEPTFCYSQLKSTHRSCVIWSCVTQIRDCFWKIPHVVGFNLTLAVTTRIFPIHHESNLCYFKAGKKGSITTINFHRWQLFTSRQRRLPISDTSVPRPVILAYAKSSM